MKHTHKDDDTKDSERPNSRGIKRSSKHKKNAPSVRADETRTTSERAVRPKVDDPVDSGNDHDDDDDDDDIDTDEERDLLQAAAAWAAQGASSSLSQSEVVSPLPHASATERVCSLHVTQLAYETTDFDVCIISPPWLPPWEGPSHRCVWCTIENGITRHFGAWPLSI